ncbi:MAG: tetratricopeptide repeat protein, partial [Myxococcota bacterium]|nr:tetratricopeptide repeat protein [Myxococcota bacterium]
LGEAAAEARRRTLLDRATDLLARRLDLLDPSDLPERLAGLHDLGTIEMSMGRYAAAAASFRSMLDAAWRLGVPAKVAAALSKLGRVHRARGDYAAAIRAIEEALRLFRSCGDMPGISGTLTDLGSLRYLLGEYPDARRCHREALALRREMEDDRGTAVALLHLAALDRADGLLGRAAAKAQEALRIGEGSAAPEELAQAMNVLGIVAFDREDHDAALGYFQEGLRLASGVDRRIETYLLNNLGELMLRTGRPADAAEPLKRALDLAAQNEDLRSLGEVQRNISRLAAVEGRPAEAVEYADRALELASRIGSAEAQALACLAVGQARAAAGPGAAGDPPDTFFRRAVETLRRIGHSVELAKALWAFASFLHENGRPGEAASIRAEARRAFAQHGIAARDPGHA